MKWFIVLLVLAVMIGGGVFITQQPKHQSVAPPAPVNTLDPMAMWVAILTVVVFAPILKKVVSKLYIVTMTVVGWLLTRKQKSAISTPTPTTTPTDDISQSGMDLTNIPT